MARSWVGKCSTSGGLNSDVGTGTVGGETSLWPEVPTPSGVDRVSCLQSDPKWLVELLEKKTLSKAQHHCLGWQGGHSATSPFERGSSCCRPPATPAPRRPTPPPSLLYPCTALPTHKQPPAPLHRVICPPTPPAAYTPALHGLPPYQAPCTPCIGAAQSGSPSGQHWSGRRVRKAGIRQRSPLSPCLFSACSLPGGTDRT